jgi:hypothetical protein
MNHTPTRRDFLKTAGVATLGALAAGYPRAAQAEETIEHPEPKADCLIVLWMAGGMAHTETFDPKRYTPFEPGIEANRILSTFPSIPTSVDGVYFSEGLERIASVLDRGTLIRTYRAGDLGHILHSRHQFQWHTGYAPPLTVAAPHIGAMVARTLGPKNPDMPPFLDIGQRFTVGEAEELKAFHTAGFLGSEYGPLFVTNPEEAMATVRPPAGMTPGRFENRYKAYRKSLESSPIGRYGSSYQQESLVRSMEKAHNLLTSPAARAFDLAEEPKDVYDTYNTGKFGLGCLLARRLVEHGARFIEVTTEYEPFMYWDTHENGHERLIGMKETIDAPVAQLVLDLEERGLLDRTLIVLASEFSRDMLMEGRPGRVVKDQVEVPDIVQETKHYGMHRHFTDAGCVLMFGGGVKKGYVHGTTADERPCKLLDNEVQITDLHATMLTLMGISPKTSYDVEKRPFYVTKDGLGKPIDAVMV